jgi:hypothetical protein
MSGRQILVVSSDEARARDLSQPLLDGGHQVGTEAEPVAATEVVIGKAVEEEPEATSPGPERPLPNEPMVTLDVDPLITEWIAKCRLHPAFAGSD